MIGWARDLVVGLCGARAGLRLEDLSEACIETRLGPLARKEGFASVEDLLIAVRDRDDDRVAWRIVEAMAPAERCFFEEPESLDHLCDVVLPALARHRPKLRLWIVGCGAGQEAYSLAMALDERTPAIAPEIFASDLSEARLEKAHAGLYTAYEVQQGLSARRLVRYFEQRDGGYLLSPSARRSVRLGRINLLDDLVRYGRFDVILCRQVLPSLTDVAARRFAGCLTAALMPDGQLLMGADEPPPSDAWRALPGPPGFFGPAAQASLAA